MLAKLITWTGTREQTIERMLRALGEYHVGGIETNIALFRKILNDPAFRNGQLHTGYLDEFLKTVDWASEAPAELAGIAAQIASRRRSARPAKAPGTAVSRWLAEGRAELLR